MNRYYVIDAGSAPIFRVSDDRADGGASIAKQIDPRQPNVMDCRLRKQFDWPYCELVMDVGRATQGADFSQFDTVELEIQLTSPGNRNLRFYLLNFEPGISTEKNVHTYKVNELEFALPKNGRITIPLHYFRVASWWASEMNVPFMRTDMRIDRVIYLKIATASILSDGDYHIGIERIRFSGKWLSQKQLMMLLVCAWLIFGISRLMLELREFHLDLLASKSQIRHMRSINRALKLETQTLAGQVRTDALTGALNREGLRDFLLKDWRAEDAAEYGVSVIFADIDYFKQINDQYGHMVGDDVLIRFAALLHAEIRSTDRLIRWGGEEFLIVCAQTQHVHAVNLAEKLRLKVCDSQWPHEIQLSCSFGVASYDPKQDFGDMIERADIALYKAKRAGRNCVETN